MSNVELVIKIDEKIIQQAKHYYDLPYDDYVIRVAEAIANGTPLPKGHGRLIDGDRFDAISYQHTSDDFDNGVMWLAEQIDNAPTIIEADKTESEE